MFYASQLRYQVERDSIVDDYIVCYQETRRNHETSYLIEKFGHWSYKLSDWKVWTLILVYTKYCDNQNAMDLSKDRS